MDEEQNDSKTALSKIWLSNNTKGETEGVMSLSWGLYPTADTDTIVKFKCAQVEIIAW